MSGDGWEHIRSLDETENWHERNMVISKTDHQAHTNWARVNQLTPLSIHHPPLSLSQEVVEDMVDHVSKQ